MYRDIPEELKTLVEPIVTDHGLELMDADLVRGRGPWQLRVVLDTPAGDGAVSVEACAHVSRELGTQLDAADAIAHAYTLEVSSPGLDRPLAREKDFAAAAARDGSDVKIETRVPLDGRRRFRGRLVGFDGETAQVSVDGREFAIPFAQVAKAHVVYPFSAADFAPRRDGSPELD
ncbi:MAG TPA: ribosome maturation factor RimP [Myxococcota bacterium]|nr:ribosome maturation factor RimP [Myxococcota bacterium]